MPVSVLSSIKRKKRKKIHLTRNQYPYHPILNITHRLLVRKKYNSSRNLEPRKMVKPCYITQDPNLRWQPSTMITRPLLVKPRVKMRV